MNPKENVSVMNRLEVEWVFRWAKLFVAIFVLWVMMTYVAPWGRQTAMFRPVMDVIEELDIKATSYYYTDNDDFAEAELQITNSLQFPPTGPLKTN